MVVKPGERRTELSETDIRHLAYLESLIDECLTEGKTGTIFANLFKGREGERQSFLEEQLFRKYREAGWNVKRFGDQNDGAYYSFT